ncbi:fumarylacetoacetate hydrolase family protein [Glaciecola sp. XM2]|uniref:fumarylacetoacetate hydrolase family protein n=1 Tax=Glaciecola sp. XM2 TaxID=1914931 RepID=UPI002546E50B|nr:fumarylacetoacetate hydrolase family protein [Glaciecola sp. XM2]
MINTYQHLNMQGQPLQTVDAQGYPVGKAVCVGRNYLDHVHELGNQVNDNPLLFMKPSTAFAHLHQPITIPTEWGECHNELELAFLIGKPLYKSRPEQCAPAISGLGLALDLTLRELQNQLKTQGHPWERAKAFDGSCPISSFMPLDYQNQTFSFSLKVNGQLRQQGDSKHMLTPVLELLSHISQCFTLMPGDVVLTGTPKGVGPLKANDMIDIDLHGHFNIKTRVAA